MLVNCPKCGFSQPQDPYCANCGVDMQAFKPKPAPMSARLLASPVVMIGLVFALVFAGSLYIIREQRRQEVTRRMDYLKNGPLYAESLQPTPDTRDSASASSDRLTSDEAELAETAPQEASAPIAVSAQALAAPVARNAGAHEAELASRGAAAATSASSPAETAVARAQSIEMSVHYALAPRARLIQIVEASRAESQFIDFGEFQMGTLRGVKNALGRLDVMENVRRRFEGATGDQLWFVGARGNDAPLGLTTRIALRGNDNGLLRGEIEILRSLHESPELSQGLVQKAFGPAEFAVPARAGLLVVLNLPRVPQYDEANMAPTQFLRLFRMPDFKQRQSDFVMLVEFEPVGTDSARPTAPAPSSR